MPASSLEYVTAILYQTIGRERYPLNEVSIDSFSGDPTDFNTVMKSSLDIGKFAHFSFYIKILVFTLQTTLSRR